MIPLVLLLLFTVLPAVEIYVLVQVGRQIGAPATVGVVLLTGVAGAALARAQGLAVLRSVQRTLERGELPADELLQGAAVLVGGTLLLTPGFVTDVLGLFCLVPLTRRGVVALLRLWVRRRMTKQGAGRWTLGAWRVGAGPVRPGPAAKERRYDLGDEEPAPDPSAPRTIDVPFSVVPGDEKAGGGDGDQAEGGGSGKGR